MDLGYSQPISVLTSRRLKFCHKTFGKKRGVKLVLKFMNVNECNLNMR